MRVLSKEFGAVTNKKQILQPLIHQNSLKIKVGDSDVAYYECTSQYPLKIEASGEKRFEL